ncbi:Mg-chelatase subunit ChlD [Amycolatopsis xylanica]|uniref:Mg-chelatase subunit ChlD n=1 Tax=Amycolatopsis xylanica TaxID=589385 RepID=A0A1H3GFH8_9PSEU|nr:Mg-chelatase subunit ChlD [Amycolatopsis xylanica]
MLGVVIAVSAVSFGVIQLVHANHACAAQTKVFVAASPDIAPALTDVVRGVRQECAQIEVQPRDSAQVAESLAISDGSVKPQVWVPSSTLALQRARQLGATQVPESGPSVASSPVVLGVAQEIAAGLGWPSKTLTWADVLGVSDGTVTPGMPDPARNPVGVSALFGLRDVTKGKPDAGPAYTSLLRRFSATTTATEAELFTRLPGADLAVQSVTTFPTSENAILRHNVAKPGAPLVSVYSPAAPSLDYPFAVLSGTDPAQAKAIEPVLSALLSQPGAVAVADAGLRAAGGQALRAATDNRVTGRGLQTARMPSLAEVDQILNQWAGVNLSARVQVLIDVSGSMTALVPGTEKTRMQATLEAAEKGLRLFKPTSQVRILTFSTKLDGDKDYREVLPMAPVGEQLKPGPLEKLRGIKATPDGQTGLYDSVLDSYRVARREWEPGRLNVVIVMTDGKNSDPGGLTREQLLGELGKLQDLRRPIPIIGIGIGPDIDATELQEITKPTGGQAFTTPDPGKIADVFFGALSKLTGA